MSLWQSDRGSRGGAQTIAGVPPSTASFGRSGPNTARAMGEISDMANIGKSISIKGDVLGEEDTVIEGRVDGRVELKNHHLTVGPNGRVHGEISAKAVTIVGNVSGNVVATERVEVRESGRLEGDISSPRLLVHEGAQINGKISMAPASGQAVTSKKDLTQPAATEARAG